MGTLYAVRHGQASFEASLRSRYWFAPEGDDPYDRLSPAGETQARLLGEYWARHGVVLDAAYAGPRRRQRRTAEIVGEAVVRAGLPWPEITVLPELDEMHAEQVIRGAAPALLESDPEVRALLAEAAAGHAISGGRFQRVFAQVIGRWASGELVVPEVEPWPAFCLRVERAVVRMRAGEEAGRRVAAFTSGGTISAIARLALHTDVAGTLELAWAVQNAAVAEFRFPRGGAPLDRFTLAAFNDLAHIDDFLLRTHR